MRLENALPIDNFSLFHDIQPLSSPCALWSEFALISRLPKVSLLLFKADV